MSAGQVPIKVSTLADGILVFPSMPSDLAFDDAILDQVKSAWLKIMGSDAGVFLAFEDREGTNAGDEEEH